LWRSSLNARVEAVSPAGFSYPERITPSPREYRATDLAKFFKAVYDSEKALFSTFLLTRFRELEVVRLFSADVRFDLRTVRVTAEPEPGFYPKRWEEREVPIPRPVDRSAKGAPSAGRLQFRVFLAEKEPGVPRARPSQAIAERAGLESVPSSFFVTGRTFSVGLFRGMTSYAGSHIVRHFPGDYVALANLSMACLACCACFRVHTVTEVNESRNSVDANPRYRLVVFGRDGHLLNMRTVGFYCLVAAHAEARCRKAHKVAGVGISVARVALQPQRQVRFMTIRDRLLLTVQSPGQQHCSNSQMRQGHLGVT
jgi:hypothetical protein